MTTAVWIAVRGWLPADREDELATVVASAGALGAEAASAQHGRVAVVVYLEPDGAVAAVAAGLRAAGGDILGEAPLPARDWLAGYRASVRPFAVGERWWIDPHPDGPTPAPDGRQRLAIEPRMAFGSGSHESTRLVLLELESEPPVGRRVLDVGTGSGVLALAAERLGATAVVGFDLDPDAIWVARQTTARQEWRSAVALFVGTADAVAGTGFDLILCNMIAEQFLPLAEALGRCLADGGAAVFSGVLATEQTAVAGALAARGLRVTATRWDGDWCALRTARG